MKTSAIRKLRRQLAADRPAVGMWITLEAPSITEMAVGLGVDWVVIDAEHGHLDWNDICRAHPGHRPQRHRGAGPPGRIEHRR